MKPSRPKTLPKKTPMKPKHSGGKEPLLVFCRLRPMHKENDVSCITMLSPTMIQLSQPDTAVNYRGGNLKDSTHTFRQVFPEASTQKEIFDVIALPLVKELVQGRNGLLFAYGVTGSGKTYTMNGTPQDGGIMPRALDVLFNSIAEHQAKKFVFKPDKLNGFDIQSDIEALSERQEELMQNINARPPKISRKNSDPELFARSPDSTRVDLICDDNAFAVFVTYVEIYNNSVYDLLEDVPEDIFRNKQLQMKIIREDGAHNMYVHGVTEVEVKSSEEAFELFYKAQKKKRMANTVINAESSRSHAVFTIRLVQAPLDYHGENVLQEKQGMIISQLSLVDLAGCERTSRTKNTGQRLREAGNINNSLMTLRTCLEILRENQLQGTNKIVPYRDSKLTHLFKNFLDGEGQVRMIVCANPRSADYDETVQVMKFAEISQDVQIARPTPVRLDFGMTPGRRRANQIFNAAVNQLHKENIATNNIPVDIGPVYSLVPEFPTFPSLSGPEGDRAIAIIKNYLQERAQIKKRITEELQQKMDSFRPKIAEVERELIILAQNNASCTALLDQERIRSENVEKRLAEADRKLFNMQAKNNELEFENRRMREQLSDQDLLISQGALDKQKAKIRYKSQVTNTAEKMNQELEKKLRKQRQELEMDLRKKDERIRYAQHILADTPTSSSANDNVSSKSEETRPVISYPSQSARKMGGVLRAPRHRRSRSAEATGRWLDHCPATPVALNTLLQPSMKKRKSVTKLTDVRDVTKGADRYCLTTQDQDTDGEIETRLYKGDVLPTVSGGAQVVFSDVELLKQTSPIGPEPGSRKRRSVQHTEVNVAERCSTAIEGHGKRPYLS